MKPNIEVHVPLTGRYKFVVRKAVTLADGTTEPGEITRESDWQNNIITNAGLDMLGGSGFMNYCQVGTGNATPVAGDTALASFLAQTNTVISTVPSVQASAPYYASIVRIWQFGPGVAAGNVAEVGIAGVTSGTLFSRALILDGGGSPTTITVLSDEYLQVSYELRMYVPTVDVTGTITIGGVSTAIVLRAANCTDGTAWNAPSTGAGGAAGTNVALDRAGAIGAITGEPTGTLTCPSGGMTVTNNAAYVPGDYHQDVQFTHPINNAAAVVQSFRVSTHYGRYQFSVSPTLAITNTQQMKVVVRISWARGVETP